MKMLVTGFTPFGGEQINPSWEAARRLPNRIGGAELIKHEIPTEFDAFKAFADTYPDSVSLLLDTYNIMESGLPNLIKLDDYLIEKYPNDPNRRVKSARIDSAAAPLRPTSRPCARHWMRPVSLTSSWWLPMVWTKRRSPTWSCMSTLILTPTAWAKT